MSPDTPVTDSPNSSSASSIEELLNSPDEPKDETLVLDKGTPKEDEEPEEESEEKEEELEEEIKLELEDLDDEEKELTEEEEFLEAPRRKQILKDFPEIFKKYPYLEKAFYKVTKYDEIFPNLDTAKISVIRSNALSAIESDINQGKIGNLFKGIKQVDPEGFNRSVDNLLKGLHEADPTAYTTVIRNVAANMISGLMEDAKEMDNEALKNAAEVLKSVIFGSKMPQVQKLAKTEEPNPEKDKVQQERVQFEQQRFTTALEDVTVSLSNTLKATIEANIDPKDSMGGYVKKNACKDALDFLENDMRKSTGLQSIMNRLWENARNNGYSRESLDKIKNAYKARAKTLMPTAIKKARADALKGSTTNTKTKDDKTSLRSGKVPAKKEPNSKDGRNMRTEDFFLQD